MNETLNALLNRMHNCAEESFLAVQRFGKGSPEHNTQIAIYSDAAKAYEAACRAMHREPYATYND